MEHIEDSEKPNTSSYSILEIKTSSTTLPNLLRVRCDNNQFHAVLFQYSN